ncbi:hypothetical protein GYMLUDRAFT_253296 [Collybiopsis luxurians FD-317 M1]|uniref:Uncharacterized protein n=1 Tax=Collybiopsis luxurians FD-317 M1 TaxID=944289 RepID=A0A0D0C5U7_9AGAR|nr:hypothetical protein GYMLUDRAFT_253296 [Collybiopsis luxurians FD-317 M1]
MPSPTSAFKPKLQPTRRGNSYSKKDRSFKEAEWSSGMRNAPANWRVKTFRQLNQEIFGAEDDEDDEPASNSDLVLLHQHLGNYIDLDEESNPNLKDPRPSKSSNPSSDKANEPIPPHSQEYCAANKLVPLTQDIQRPSLSHTRECQPFPTP